ncbi:MAG: O-antigen ligase family protein [Microgenomates group bacterium]
MVFIQSLVLVGLSLAFFFGQLWRLNIGSLSFPVIDIFLLSFALTNLYFHHTPKNKYLFYFVIFSWISLLLNYLIHPLPWLISATYLLRLTGILSLFIFPPIIPQNIKKLFFTIIIANIIFGLIQYFIWPDFTYFKAIGWDDHLNRLLSTYFDPTFTALIYLLFFIHLFFKKKITLVSSFLFLVTFLALAFTYSRSTFLSLIICGLFVSLVTKKSIIFFGSLILIGLTIIALPRPAGEGTKLERTSSISAKLVNTTEALKLFCRSPLIGFGYNNLPNIQQNYSSHSNSGFDSSLLTLLVTTGLIGLTLFLTGFWQLFLVSSLETKTMLVAIFIHSLFANSLLYPFTLIFLILI